MNNMLTLRRLATTGLFATGALILAPSALAHDALVSTNPSADSTVTATPSSIDLTFSESVMKVGNQVAIKAPNGEQTKATPTVTGSKVSVPFKAAGNGAYAVTWRVTSSDGHPVSGTFNFTLKDSKNTASAASTATKSAGTATQEPSASAGALAKASASTTKGPSTPTTDEPGDNQPWLIGAGVVGALALIGGGWYLAKGRVKNDPGM